MTWLLPASACAAVLWTAVLAVPWRPWSTRERLDADPAKPGDDDLSQVTAVVPARDESAVIARSVGALRAQGTDLRIIVIDDQSSDDTAEIAMRAGGACCEVLTGTPLPSGWVGKMWALEQGRRRVQTPLTLLVDADIELRPGLVPALLAKRRAERARLVSLMAALPMQTPWESLLVPAFVYFFKLLYPFALSNGHSRWIAAAAGGCVLVETAALEEIGGFGSLRGELIDDCALARRVKDHGGRTWIGLTHSAVSLRAMGSLRPIWEMVARSAFAQLRFSITLLALCALLLILAFWVPVTAVLAGGAPVRLLAVVALAAMWASYLPTLRYYRQSPAWALTLPLAGTLYLGMTLTSAMRAWRGVRSRWKGRVYQRMASGTQP